MIQTRKWYAVEEGDPRTDGVNGVCLAHKGDRVRKVSQV